MSVALVQIETFLVLAEELHFGRASERLYVSQSMVSRRIVMLERDLGGALFERTSRQVRLTPLGSELLDHLRPAYGQLRGALRQARASAGEAAGLVRIGVAATTGSPALTRIVEVFRSGHRDCQVDVCEVELWDPLGALRRDEVDIILNWQVLAEPDLTIGPTVEYRERVLAVSARHRLSRSQSVSAEELAEEKVIGAVPDTYPDSLLEALFPQHTPSGRPIRRDERPGPVTDVQEVLHRIGLGEIVQPTMAGIPVYLRPDIVLVPIQDLPPMPLGLIWCTAHENARIRAFASVASQPG